MTDAENPGRPAPAGPPASTGPESAQPPTLAGSVLDLQRPAAGAEAQPPASKKADTYLETVLDGRYRIERLLGEGGMGVVYAARHTVIGKRVAIKVLRHDMANDEELNERFLQEAKAASAIGNPHIVDISDFGRAADGSTYFVMELLDGVSLSEALHRAKGPIPVPRLCRIGQQIAQALAAAHAASIVHRDLKPDNVMLVRRGNDPDFVKILDFGIAKVGSGTKRVTRAGSIFGTPHYMSPEQAAGAAVDHRTDIYALGVILYEMASGKVPFDADNFMGILTQHMYKAPVPIRALLPEVDVPPGLDAIVLKCLTKKPEGRYATMEHVVADLDKLERGELPDAVNEMMARSGGFNVPADYFRTAGAMAPPMPASPAAGRHPRRWPLVLSVSAVATVVAIMAIVMVARTTSSPAQTPSASVGVPAPSLPPAPSATAPAPAPPPPVEVAKREVLVSVTPGDATIERDGADLGSSPVALHLADAERASLVLSRKGFKTKTVVVSTDAPKQSFAMDPLPSAPGPKPAVAPAAHPAPPGAGIDDIDDPFANKKR